MSDDVTEWLEQVKAEQDAKPTTRAEIMTALTSAGIHASRPPNIVGGKAPTAWDSAHAYIDKLLNQLARTWT